MNNMAAEINIGDRKVGLNTPCYMIAEIGVNHNGDIELAKKMISAAKSCGADAVKFQTFTAERLVTQGTPKVRYQEDTTSAEESHYDMIKKLELNEEGHVILKKYCASVGIEFISTPYDIESARFLNELGVSVFKTASADIVDLPLHHYLAETGKPVIVATGMATMDEVESVVDVYNDAKNYSVALLHCVSNYPCSNKSLNLRVIGTLQSTFDKVLGFSDHTSGETASVMAVTLGAKIIEKHFTLDKTLPGPDHKASADPDEFRKLVVSVRFAEEALGSPLKQCQDEEKQMALVSRKSIVMKIPVRMGERLTREHFTLKRPGTGLMAKEIPGIIGKTTRRDLPANHVLAWNDFE